MDWNIIWTSPYWDYFDKIGLAAAFVAMVFSFLNWLGQRRRESHDNALIAIRLRCPDPEVTITLQGLIRRKNLTRAEVQGMLGALPFQGARYDLDSFNKKAFFEQLEAAQDKNAVTEVIVPCSAEELMQFDYDELRNAFEVSGELPAKI